MKIINHRKRFLIASIIINLSLSNVNAFQGSDVGSCRNYNCGLLGTLYQCSQHAPQTSNQIRRDVNTLMQTPHPTTPTALHAFRGSDYNSNNNFGEDDDDVDEDDEPPKLDTSPQEFLYRMQQRESQNKSSDSTSDDSSSNNNDSILSAPSYGPGRGRSTPQIRSAFGAKKNKSSSSLSNNIKRGAKGDNDKDTTTVHVCTNCGAEYIQWRGQCSTCLEWNTIQEYTARRKPSGSGSNSKMKPIFGKQQQGKFSQKNNNSWLDGIDDYSYNSGGGSSGGPVRVTDVYQEILSDTDDISLDAFQNGNNRERRTLVPDDSELNTVLGGGIMPGSICLVGGDPGVFCLFVGSIHKTYCVHILCLLISPFLICIL